MAEQVQAVLDSMVAPLRDLMERDIFSSDEIKSIVARRRESEYLTRRRAVRKADYLRYLEDELNLEKLRALRTKRHRQWDDEAQEQTNKHIGDVHVQQHLHYIFTRALRKFRSDVSLYLQYADFLKSIKANTKLGRIYAEALQFHPRHAGLWIEAASHEYFELSNTASARILLQRGLRVNPSTSQDLWLQYFMLELHSIQKLRGRREILQLQQEDESSSNNSDVPIVVYDNAIQAIPDNVTFRLKFLDSCRMFPETDVIERHVVDTIGRDFEQSAEAWIARGAFSAQQHETADMSGFAMEPRKKRQRISSSSPVLAVLQEATQALATAEMYLASIQFLRSYAVEQTQDEIQACNEFIHGLFQKAVAQDVLSSELVLQEADILVQEGKLNEAVKVLEGFCTSHVSHDVEARVWLQWAKLSEGSSSTILRRALERTPVHSKKHMTLLLELFGALLMETADLEESRDDLQPWFQRILLLSAGVNTSLEDAAVFGVDSVAMACLKYLHHATSTGGIGAARRVYEQVLYQSNFGQHDKTPGEWEVMKEFINECIRLEKGNRKKLKRLYGAAIDLFKEVDPAVADSYRSRRDNDVRYA